jgi:hypothetical protein
MFTKAFETPIAYLSAGLIKAIETAKDAINALPFIGDDKASKARAFKVILEQEIANKGNLSRDIDKFAKDGYKKADAIIDSTSNKVAGFVQQQANAVREGFEKGASTFEVPDSVKGDQERLYALINKAVGNVEDAGKATAKMAKDAELEVGDQVIKAVGNDGNKGGITQGDQVIASSLAQIGGGGGVFSTMASVAREQVGILKQQLAEAKMQNRMLGELAIGGRVME